MAPFTADQVALSLLTRLLIGYPMKVVPKARNRLAFLLRSPQTPHKYSIRKDKRRKSRGKLKLDLKDMATRASAGVGWLGFKVRW